MFTDERINLISLHPDIQSIGNARLYSHDWKILEQDSIENLTTMITSHAVSPIIFYDGKRSGDNFDYSDWLALDIDDGVSIEEATLIFAEYRMIIGTTKSHGIKGTSDRFRVFIPWEGTIDCPHTYRASVKEFIGMVGADNACGDLARMFWPCKEIVLCKTKGRAAEVTDEAQKVWNEYDEEKKAMIAVKRMREAHSNGSIPLWIRRLLDRGAPGKVNTSCFNIALALTTIGHSADEIVALILNSNLPNPKAGIAFTELQREVELAVRSGAKTAVNNLENLGGF